jgi:hypothetical protein
MMDNQNSGQQPSGDSKSGGPLLSLRSAVVLGLAALGGAGASVLTAQTHVTPAADVLAGAAAFVGGVAFFNSIIS